MTWSLSDQQFKHTGLVEGLCQPSLDICFDVTFSTFSPFIYIYFSIFINIYTVLYCVLKFPQPTVSYSIQHRLVKKLIISLNGHQTGSLLSEESLYMSTGSNFGGIRSFRKKIVDFGENTLYDSSTPISNADGNTYRLYYF